MIQIPNLIVGGDSRIGSEIANALGAASTSRRVPIAQGKIPFDLRRPSWLPLADRTFFCAGINTFNECYEDPEEAKLINYTNTVKTAQGLVDRGGKVIFLSSAAAETHPETVYGKLKFDAENWFLKFGSKGSIFRFGPVAFTGKEYACGDYHPIKLDKLVHIIAFGFVPGLHKITNT